MRFSTLRRALLAPGMIVVALLSALPAATSSALAAPAASTDYSNICPGESQADFQSVLGANANSTPLVTSSDGHCVKFSVNGGPRAGYALAKSGDLITLYGVGGWKTNSSVQIWQSDAFPKRNADHKFPPTNQIIGPDTDIHRECRTLIKGNQANPLKTYATLQSNGGDQLAFDPVTFLAPNVTETSIFNIRVSIPNPPCTALPGSGTETQATDALLIVQPVVNTCLTTKGACLTISPQVVYPGQSFNVSGQNLPSSQSQLTIGVPQTSVCLPLSTLDGSSSANVTAPPFSNLPLTNQTNGIYHFKVYASSDNTCTSAAAQDLYVAPPTLSVPTQLISGTSGSISGISWIGGAANTTSPTPLQIVAFISSEKNFNCSSAKVLSLASSSDGTFNLSYKAPDVNGATNDEVRVAAIPTGASTSSVCASFDDTSCQSATAGTNCPLIAATAPLQIVPQAAASVNWLLILIPLGLLLLLLPLFFWLGRREEDELVVIDEDITQERVAVDATNSQRVKDLTFHRTVRETRERVRLRDGKVLDKEVAEYDIYRDAAGTETRLHRTPGAGTPPATGTAATQV